MSDPERAAVDTGSSPGESGGEPETAGDGPEHDAGEALERAVEHLREIGRGLASLLDLLVERARVGVREGAFRLLAAVWMGLATVAATVLAVWLVLVGMAGGLARLFGDNAWAGRLLAGILVLMLLACAGAIVRSRSRRIHLERLHRKYARRGGLTRGGRGGASP